MFCLVLSLQIFLFLILLVLLQDNDKIFMLMYISNCTKTMSKGFLGEMLFLMILTTVNIGNF